jgi:hypothetical protein
MTRVLVMGAVLGAATLAACVTGVGYDGEVEGGYGPGYLEPYGYEYGGWGDGYLVGPGRGGERRGPTSPHAYHSAPQSRPTPSIPHGARGGGNGGGRR